MNGLTTETTRQESGDRVMGNRSRDRVIEKSRPVAFSASPRLYSETVRYAPLLSVSGVPIARSPDHRITRSQRALRVVRQAKRRLRAAWQIILAALREMFDENAYERFLTRTQDTRSVASYRAFLRERETATARKARCC